MQSITGHNSSPTSFEHTNYIFDRKRKEFRNSFGLQSVSVRQSRSVSRRC